MTPEVTKMETEYELRPEMVEVSVRNSVCRPVKVFRCGSCCAHIFVGSVTVNGQHVKRPIISFGKQYVEHGLPRKTSTLQQDDLPAAILALGEANDWLRRAVFDRDEDPGAL